MDDEQIDAEVARFAAGIHKSPAVAVLLELINSLTVEQLRWNLMDLENEPNEDAREALTLLIKRRIAQLEAGQ
jgi:hypothetical protein